MITATEIYEHLVSLKLNFGGMSEADFISGVKSAYGCSTRTAKAVAKKTGNF